MSADGATVTSAVAPATTRRPLRSLTRLASLNAAASLLDFAVRMLVGVVVTPILVRGLGATYFGVWEMLLRLSGYVSSTDGRPTEALRLVIAQGQGHTNDEAKRRAVGAAIAVWVVMLPVLLSASVALTWFAPSLIGVAPSEYATVRTACALLISALMIGSLAATPESVLRGMNLAHKRVGVQTALSVLGGALAAGAVWSGLGVVGLGASFVLRAAITGLCFWFLARQYVSWFGADRPARSDVKAMLGMSVWLMAGDLIAKLALASDVLILGAVLTPAAVTTYALTGYAVRAAVGVHVFTAGEAIPGVGGLLGTQQFSRATQARRELLTMTWLFITAAGATVLFWNQAFLTVWVGPQFYAGALVTLLTVLVAAQTAFIRVDAYLIDATLKPRGRVIVGAIAAVLTVAFSIAGTIAWGITGLCIGMLAGRTVQSVGYPIFIARHFAGNEARGTGSGTPPVPHSLFPVPWLRPLLATGALFATAMAASAQLVAMHWIALCFGVVGTFAASTAAALFLGGSAATRQTLVRRIRALRPGGRDK